MTAEKKDVPKEREGKGGTPPGAGHVRELEGEAKKPEDVKAGVRPVQPPVRDSDAQPDE